MQKKEREVPWDLLSPFILFMHFLVDEKTEGTVIREKQASRSKDDNFYASTS